MVWLTLGISVLLLLAMLVFLTALNGVLSFFTKQLTETRLDFQHQRDSWEVEKERLLNRVMTKEWESYTQMTGAMQAVSPSDMVPAEGLSDERESERWAQMHGGSGLGEIFGLEDNDDDAKTLGLL